MLNTALLGAGRIAGVHATAISTNPGSRLVAVSDINTEAAIRLAAQYGAEARSTDAILADASINAVLIATSTDTHSDLIERATGAGKAVLCEKPVDLSLARAQACRSVAAKNGKPVMIGFNRRFDPNFSALKAALEKGEIGKAELLSITSFDPAPPPVAYIKVSGGLFRDMMIHDFDMANYIMGAAPVSVSAVGSSIVDPAIGAAGDVDTAVVTLTYAAQAFGTADQLAVLADVVWLRPVRLGENGIDLTFHLDGAADFVVRDGAGDVVVRGRAGVLGGHAGSPVRADFRPRPLPW